MEPPKLLIDTNVVLDFLLARKPFDLAAKKIFELAVNEEAKLYISINSFTDIIYFVRKEYDVEAVRIQMEELLDFVDIIEAGHRDAQKSLKMTDLEDIEDAFQVQCALKVCGDYIITRDMKGFRRSSLPALMPEEYLKRLEHA
jgi:predicted nucleic acid-binding protein